jgi:alanine racemase
MKPKSKRRALTHVSINVGAVQHNIREIFRITQGLPLMAVVKANAYGHGMIPIAKAAVRAGVSYLAVASIEEALMLRKQGVRIPILVLSYVSLAVSRDTLLQAIQKNIDLVVFDIETAHLLSVLGRRTKKNARIHIKVDTGTTRIGIFPRDFSSFYQNVLHLPRVTVVGVFTHFAESENTQSRRTNQQIRALRSVQKIAEKQNTLPLFHAACSAALLAHPHSRFSAGRLGISLYGLWPDSQLQTSLEKKIHLQPALSWHTKILQVKEVPKGTRISYDGTYKAPRKMRIAILPVGYADGFPRALSNNGNVLIYGKYAAIRGRVCMNLTMVDVTQIPRAHVGSPVTLIGSDGTKSISADEMAQRCDTISYEIVTRINWTLPRYYSGEK